jgi:hypothetical protein
MREGNACYFSPDSSLTSLSLCLATYEQSGPVDNVTTSCYYEGDLFDMSSSIIINY